MVPSGSVVPFSLHPLGVGSRSLPVLVLKALAALAEGTFLKLRIAPRPGAVVVLFLDLVLQIDFERCLLRLGG